MNVNISELNIPYVKFANLDRELKQAKKLDKIFCKLLFAQLQFMGVFKDQTQIIISYRQWFAETVETLLRHHYLLEASEAGFVFSQVVPDAQTVWKQWEQEREAWLKDDNLKATIILLETTLRALPDILTGKTNAVDVVFPNSSMRLVEGIYKNNKVADYFNEVLANALIAYLQHRWKQDERAKIKIFEIGAGTGGTSARIFQRLNPYRSHIQEYCYTDISRSFLLHGEKNYGPVNPYLSYKIFNVERPVAEQGIDLGAYDVVIAANVLHATKKIRHTVRNAKALLKNQGCLLLHEVAATSLFAHLTFGLLEGWWLYEDKEWRIPGSPGLYPKSWHLLLENEGFKSRNVQPENHPLGHQTILAISDGIIRQEQSVALTANTLSMVKREIKMPTADQEKLLYEKATLYFLQLIGETLKIPLQKMDPSEPLEKYGIDSIVIVELTNQLQRVLEGVTSTLFFEYQTIDALVNYFIKSQKDRLAKLLQIDAAVIQGPINEPARRTAKGESRPKQKRPQRTWPSEESLIHPKNSEIAIIGVSGRYAQANNIEELWNNLKEAKSCITEIPNTRFPWNQYYDPEKGKIGSIYTKWGGFIEDFDKFDPSFFQISPLDAEGMDPQERCFLETAYASIEDAGYIPANLSLSKKVGVFVGVMNKNYPTGYGYWSLANRISYLLNFSGPSLAVDTACSSSLTAIHLAIESICSGTSDCAIAGGVNLIVHPTHMINLSMMQMLSSTDQCKAFGEGADGFVDGEGVGALILKPLVKAIEDGDHIYAVIKSSMINAGGKTNGYTVPNPQAQSQVIKDALNRGGISSRTISYVEAHGTGTSLGDPLELSGLTKAFAEDTTDLQFCSIGSLKSNIGHCESAAGVAGVTKVLLQLKHRHLVPSLHSTVTNPQINFVNTPFILQHALQEWKRPLIEGREVPRRAGISSFGAGGANAHLILEEYIPSQKNLTHPLLPTSFIIVLSAKNKERLQLKALLFLKALQRSYTDADLPSIAYTLQTGREAMEERLGVCVKSISDLIGKLEQFLAGERVDGLFHGNVKKNKEAWSVFTKDEDMDQMVDLWIGKEKTEKLTQLWTQGLSIDWNKLYSPPDGSLDSLDQSQTPISRLERPHRVSLPSYPFARERYWIKNETIATPIHRSEQEYLPQKILAFEERWIQEERPLAQEKKRADIWICFLSEKENQKAVLEELQALNSQTKVIFIAKGQMDKNISPWEYTILPQKLESYEAAFKSIQETHQKVDAVLYMWAVEDPNYIRDYTPLILILQSMKKRAFYPARFVLSGLYHNGLDRCYLESWIGLERSMRIPLPETKIFGIYGAAARKQSQIAVAEWVGILWNELQTPTQETVLYDDLQRYVSRIHPLSLHTTPSRLRRGGNYLITGGLGGLGFLIAKHLIETYQAQVILMGRSPLDEEKHNRIQILQKLGGHVIYIQADVSNLDSMQKGLQQAKKHVGALHGIIHAAGVLGGKSIFEKDPPDFTKITESKISGTLLLDQWSIEEPLDFICYFSSSAAVLGDFGSCDYAMGNRFQMAYAQYRHKLGFSGNTVVINWPVWREGGMKIGDEIATNKYLQSSGQQFLETKEGLHLFDQLVSGENRQCLILAGNQDKIISLFGPQYCSFFVDSAVDRAHPFVSQEEKTEKQAIFIERDLKEMIHKIAKISVDTLDLNVNWTDFGLNSINLSEFSDLLNKNFGLHVNPTLFFKYLTLNDLISYLLKEHKESLERFYGKQPLAPPAHPVENDACLDIRPMYKPNPSLYAEPIAVIGMSGRFPQADSVEEFWQNIKQNRSCITEVPNERWDWREYENEAINPRWGGFLKKIDRFDPLFFQISPKEAENIDPRQRIFLEEAWRTFEDAGYMQDRIRGKSCGVYVGVEEGEYPFLAGADVKINGCQNATLAARISYVLDLKGPNFALTAACASSLVAIHQACISLQQGDCEMALVGGASLNISRLSFELLNKAEMLSRDSQCKVFDTQASGLIPGEAVAAVLLKPLSKAIKDRDHIYGCIKGSGVNYNGKSNGITSPNPQSQTQLLLNIYNKYDIDPLDIQYVMAHSTGSKLGDPLEVEALTNAFEAYTHKKQFCTIGSIKPLIGHTFAASGIVGIIAMLLSVRDKTIPATQGARVDNEYIKFRDTPFVLTSANQEWIAKQNKGRLGTVSSTGISGTNAHVVVQEYVSHPKEVCKDPSCFVIVLSAKDRAQLQVVVKNLLKYVESKAAFSLLDLAYTLQVGREAMECRWAAVIHSKSELIQRLQEYLQNPSSSFPVSEDLDGSKDRFLDIAQTWVKGAKIAWDSLYKQELPYILPLPTYPFKEEVYKISHKEKNTAQPKVTGYPKPEIQTYILQFLKDELGLTEAQINWQKKLQDYGLDSILQRKLLRSLKNDLSLDVTGREMVDCQSLKDIAAYLSTRMNCLTTLDRREKLETNALDLQVVEAMEKFTLGEGDFAHVQTLLEEMK